MDTTEQDKNYSVEELTPEQEALMKQVRDEWLDIGVSTEPATEDEMKQAVDLSYRCAELKPPQYYYFFASQKAGAVAVALLQLQNPEGSYDVEPYSPEVLAEKVEALMGLDVLPKDVRDETSEAYKSACFGQHDAGWLSFYDFFEKIGVEGLDSLQGLKAAARTCGWWWPMENIAVVTQKTTKVCRDDEGQLHCEDGKALGYADGWGLYSWHGIEVPDHFILQPATIVDTEIDRIETKKQDALKAARAKRPEDVELTLEETPSSDVAKVKRQAKKLQQEIERAEKVVAYMPEFRREMEQRRTAAQNERIAQDLLNPAPKPFCS